MEKNIYSLMLQSEVVKEIDRMATSKNISRSALVNEILAEYASVKTPKKITEEIISYMEEVFNRKGSDLIPLKDIKEGVFYLKGTLDYKYSPTLKYEIDLDKERLLVHYRTTSKVLLSKMNEFFHLISYVENKHLKKKRDFVLSSECFERSLKITSTESAPIGQALAAYLGVFHTLFSGFVSGAYGDKEIEKLYKAYLSQKFGEI